MTTPTTSEPCADQALLLQGLLDGELDASNTLHVEAHLARCGSCADHYERLRAGRERRSTAGVRYRAPDYLHERIRVAIAMERISPAPLDPPMEEGAMSPVPVRGRRILERWPIAIALAACLALFAVLPRGIEHGGSSLPDELVSGHVRSLLASHLTDVATSDQHNVKPWFAGKISFAPPVADLSDRGFTLVGGRLDYVGGRVVAALVYKRRGHFINMFIWPETSTLNEGSLAHMSRDGYNLLRWTQVGLVFWAVSDLNATELQEFKQDFAERTPT